MKLQEKTCLITGAGSGIGRSTALRFASEGANVYLVGRTLSKVEAVCGEIEEAGGNAAAFCVDVADREGVFGVVKGIEGERGAVDVLVNNAGHSSPHRRLLSTPPEDIASVVDSNLIGTIYCAQAVMPAMLERDSGTIINVSSLAGVTPGLLGGMIYSAVKAAVINFTGHLNEEFKSTNVRASVVIPGEITTPLLDKRPVPPSADARRTMAGPDDVAEAIALIAGLPQNSSIPELVIRPTYQRDVSVDLNDAWV
ncbi:MAG: SDR family oxidoreductase [Rhodospirillales bacterium]|nr:SDR family oxidoreductase [Rhodospirillales bacterium]